MKSNLHRCRLGKRVATISMAWRAETPCGAFGFGHCGWNGKLAAVMNANGFVTAYAYDVMDRLASDGGVTYTYDAAGNRMTKTENGETVVYTLGAGDRLASYGRAASPLAAGGGSYTYDAAGNVTQIVRDGGPTLDLVWNGQYQLVSVSTNGVFAEGYAYDALGRRAATTTREGTTRHVYDDNWQVVADIDGQGNVLVSYVWGEGIDRLLAVKLGEATYYPLTDVQGTVWGYVDSQNNIVARWQYDAWGNVVEESVSVPALATLRYRFQGREWSAATGLTNFRMRWYDSETGRWLSKDPIGLSGGLNLYAFCMDSPIGIIDPMGNDAYISGSSGHATMWVDEPGENGKVAIFDFGPATGGWNDYNRNLIYGKGKTVVTRSNKKDSMGRYDVRIVTSEATDRAIIDCMEQYKKEDHDYSFLFNNCAQAVRTVLIRSGVDDIGWCVWPEGLVESIRNRGGSYEPYNVFSHNPYFCPLR